MSLNTTIYFCNQCKSITKDLDSLFFVEDNSAKGFCSEECIEIYYKHFVLRFEGLERAQREELGISKESCLQVISDTNYMEKVFSNPSEIWCLENSLEEKIYFYISHFDIKDYGAFSMIVSCLVFENNPSFIIMVTATQNEEHINSFRVGKAIKDPKEFTKNSEALGVEVDQESLTIVEAKKSSYLAKLLEERSVADIPVEQFTNYDGYLRETLESSDEIYNHMDEEGDKIFTYIKAFENNGISFYYISLCMTTPHAKNQDTEVMIPIISFPTVDGDIYREYAKGKQINGGLKS